VIAFRPLARGDFPTLVRWFATPHVSQWWTSGPTVRDVEDEYGDAIDGTDPTDMFVVELDGVAIGLIERYMLADYPKWDAIVALGVTAAGIDYLIGEPDCIGRGIGTAMIAQFVDATFGDPAYAAARAIVAAPQQANRASWRALERAGFQLVRAVDDLHSDDPDDKGPAFIYAYWRPAGLGPLE